MTTRHSHQPTKPLLRAWQFIRERSALITPDCIARAAQIGHDLAEEYIREWLEYGVLIRAPRYPEYVYLRSQDWHTKMIAQKLNEHGNSEHLR